MNQQMENSIHALLENELGRYIKDIRLKGFMVGLDPYPLKKDLRDIAFQHHNLLLNFTSNGTLRLLPPVNLPYDGRVNMIECIKVTLRECIA
jgi:acetylornithine/succinyldiaminopimelate/putrescine aminotransferase